MSESLILSIILVAIYGFLTFICVKGLFKKNILPKKIIPLRIITAICLVSFLLSVTSLVYVVRLGKNPPTSIGMSRYQEKGTVNLKLFLDTNGTVRPLNP
ncbi:MAG: hypothetical protein WC415_05075 [Patescibacteria group bacterium]|jgi:hypothetical protein